MHLLILILVVLVVLALSIYAVDLAPIPDPPIRALIKLVLVGIAIAFIVSRAGLL